MGKNEIVGEFFKQGHLLTDEALTIIEETGVEEFLARKLPFIIDSHDLHRPYKVLMNLTYRKKEITTEDFVKFYNSKYEKMKEIITARIQKNFVSLNKIDSTRSEVHVIGIVKEIKENDQRKVVELEDTTTSIPVILEDLEDLELDDVVAIRAVSGGKVLFGKKILYPDMPLRNPTIGTGRACFVSDLRLDESSSRDIEIFFEWFSQQDIPYLFVAGRMGDKELFEKYVERYCYIKTIFVIADDSEYPNMPQTFGSGRIVSLSNPAMVELGGLKILMCQKADIKMLKKRYLGKSKTILDEDYLVLTDVPDIVHCGYSDEPYITNYKSATIVNSGSLLGEFKPIVIDFATRDVEKINLVNRSIS